MTKLHILGGAHSSPLDAGSQRHGSKAWGRAVSDGVRGAMVGGLTAIRDRSIARKCPSMSNQWTTISWTVLPSRTCPPRASPVSKYPCSRLSV